MANWFIMFVLALVVTTTIARDVPNNDDDATTMKDQKNFLSYGGFGGYSGVGENGFPFGGVGGGIRAGFGDDGDSSVGLGGGGLGGGGPGFGGLAGNGADGGFVGGAGGLGDDGGDDGGVPLPP